MNNRILTLEKLKGKEKFSNEEWENHGLNPSEKSLCISLENSLNDLLADLIFASNTKKSDQEVENIVELHYKAIKKRQNYLRTVALCKK